METNPLADIAPTVEHTNPDARVIVVSDSSGEDIFINLGTKSGRVMDVVTGEWGGDGGMLRLLVDRCETDRDVAIQLIAMQALWAMHEGFEFVEADGKRVANPHPGYAGKVDEEMFSWLLEKLDDLIREYAERYPAK